MNKAGGIYGRRLEFTAAPSNQDLANSVFAIVATLDQTPAPSRVPSLGPISNAAANSSTYTVVASIADQIAVLGEYLRTRHLRRVYWVRSEFLFDDDVASAWAELTKRGIVEHAETKTGADALLFTGSVTDLERLLREGPNDLPVATLNVIAGQRAFDWPANESRRLLLVYPALLPEDIDFSAVSRIGAPARYVVPLTVALAAARVAIEALHEFRTELVPPVTFGPQHYAGVRGGVYRDR